MSQGLCGKIQKIHTYTHIYIFFFKEHVPPDADHDWIKGIFSVYGDIDYISIPKFKYSNDSKGFAFVEFAKAESAQKAIEVNITLTLLCFNSSTKDFVRTVSKGWTA